MNLMTVCTSFPFGLGRVDSLGILSKKKTGVSFVYYDIGYGDEQCEKQVASLLRFCGINGLTRRDVNGHIFIRCRQKDNITPEFMLRKLQGMEPCEMSVCLAYPKSLQHLSPKFSTSTRRMWALYDCNLDRLVPKKRVTVIDWKDFVKEYESDLFVCGDLHSFKSVVFLGHRALVFRYRFSYKNSVYSIYYLEDSEKYICFKDMFIDEKLCHLIHPCL